MNCPCCKKDLPARFWSPVQWRKGSAVIEVEGWLRNCCNGCSDEPKSWYYKDPTKCTNEFGKMGMTKIPSPQRPSATRPSSSDLQLLWVAQIGCLRSLVPQDFWGKMCEHFTRSQEEHKGQLAHLNAEQGVKATRTLRKWYSYYGACRILSSPAHLPHWGFFRCPHTQVEYVDLGNRTYKAVMTAAFPQACRTMGWANEGTLGDLLESLLGYYYIKTVLHLKPASVEEQDVVAAIEKAAFAHRLLTDLYPW